MQFDEIYREYRAMVASTVRHMVGPADAEDVTQSVFLEVFRSLPRFRGESKVKTWVYRIAINVALQHRRRRSRKKWLTFFVEPNAEQRIEDTRPVQSIAARETLRNLQEAIDNLTEKKRLAFVLVEVERMSPSEASNVLGVPANTIRSRVMAARKEVLAALDRKGGLHD
jgi:RNA polymerase sigma-70 factor (ECF subfamily)